MIFTVVLIFIVIIWKHMNHHIVFIGTVQIGNKQECKLGFQLRIQCY